MSDLTLTIAGQDVPFRAFTSKGGNQCWGVLDKRADGSRYLSKYGVKIPALDGLLPSEVSISDGSTDVPVYLAASTTQDGRAKVSYSGATTLPNSEIRNVTVSISRTKSGDWNLIAKAIGIGTGDNGGGRGARSLTDL